MMDAFLGPQSLWHAAAVHLGVVLMITRVLLRTWPLKDIDDLLHDQRLLELWVQFLYSKSSAWFSMWSMVLYFKCLMNACVLLRIWPLKDMRDLLHDQRLLELWVQFLYSKSSAWFSMWSMVLYFKCLMNACVLLRIWPLKDMRDLLHDQRLLELWVQFLHSTPFSK